MKLTGSEGDSAVPRSAARRRGGIRFEISNDLVNARSSDSSEEEEGEEEIRARVTRSSSMARRIPVRNGRTTRGATPSSVHPDEDSVASFRSASSNTGSTAASNTNITARGSEIARRVVRRSVTVNPDEPHPYGLETRNSSTPGSQIQSTSRTVTASANSSRTSISTITLSSDSSQASNRGLELTGNAHHDRRAREEVESNYSTSSFHSTVGRMTPVPAIPSTSQSCFGTNGKPAGVDGPVTLFGSIKRTVRKISEIICTYIYFFLVRMFCFEKWCLNVKKVRKNVAQENHSGGYMNGRSRTYAELDYQQSNLERMTAAAMTATSLLAGIWNFISNKVWSRHIQDSHDERREHEEETVFSDAEGDDAPLNSYTGAGNNFHGVKNTSSKFLDYSRELGKILFGLALVILAVFILWNFGDYLWSVLRSSCGSLLTNTIGAFSAASSVLVSNISCILAYLASLTNQSAQVTEKLTPPASSVKTEEIKIYETIVQRQDSKETLAALKATQENIDALKLRMLTMAETLRDHELHLGLHDQSIKSLESDVKVILSAMKAASTKEKSVEQIIDEVMSVTVGEMTDGTPVTLKSMFNVMIQNEELQRISSEIELKLRALGVDIYRMQEGSNAADEKFANLRIDLHNLNSQYEHIETLVEEKSFQSQQAELDIDKVKEVVMPVLISEIEKQVSLSCATRNCPEGGPFVGLATEDIELMIKRAISKYDADKTGLPDLALESAGGSILSTRCTKSSELRNSVISYWGFRLWSPPNTPRTIIQPGVVPGECWAFEGSVGDVVIKLAVPSIVTGFTLEHIPKIVSRYDHIDSAPKHFQVLGLMSEQDTIEVHDYGTFTYEDNNEPLQYFPVVNESLKTYPIVELKVLSNHGNMKHTCIYRFRVHGAIDLTRSHL